MAQPLTLFIVVLVVILIVSPLHPTGRHVVTCATVPSHVGQHLPHSLRFLQIPLINMHANNTRSQNFNLLRVFSVQVNHFLQVKS